MIGMRQAIQSLADFASADINAPGQIVVKGFGRRTLCHLFAASGFTEGAEIGVWTGHFSKELCQNIPGLHLRCVDPWEAYPEYQERKNDQARLEAAFAEARERLAPFNCTLMRMTSVEAASMVPDRSIDFVYIDGNHGRAHVLADLEAWSPKVRRGGVVAGHDFETSPARPWIEVEAAVREFTATHGIATWFVLAGDKAPSYFWVVS